MTYDPIKGLQVSARREKSRRASSHRGPKPASSAQWTKLNECLGGGLRASELESYVRYANGGSAHGICTPPMPFTPMTLSNAIDLAIQGENIYGSDHDLFMMTCDLDYEPDEKETGKRRQRHYARLKGKRKTRDYSEGNTSTTLSPERVRALMGKAASSSTLAALEAQRRKRLALVVNQDRLDNGDGASVQEPARKEGPGEH